MAPTRDIDLFWHMHMLSPVTISMPFKLLLFVLIDGWGLLVRGLLQGYL